MAMKKRFKLFDAVFAAVCVVLVVETAAPSAAVGSLQYFWWALLLVVFFLPYGMITAELGTAYEDEGGLYDWVKRAFGQTNGTRVAWYYWLCFAVWMASLAVLFTDIFTSATGIEIPFPAAVLIQLGVVWLVVFISNYRVSQSKWLLNIGAFIKVGLILLIGVLGIRSAVGSGIAQSVNEAPPLAGMAFVSIILFNFMGFEVVTTFAGEMRNPKREIPKAIVIGGVLISAFYLFSAFGISAAIPPDEISMSSGFIDSLVILLGSPQNGLILVAGLLFMFTLVANLASWSLGVNYVAMYAAREKALPRVFESESKKTQMPKGSNRMTGIVASGLVIAAALVKAIGGNQALDSFWTFYALNVVLLLVSYLFLFPAFYKLRKTDPDRPRPYRVKGGKHRLWLISFVPVIVILMALFFLFFPYDGVGLAIDWQLAVATGAAFLMGEAMVVAAKKRERRAQAQLLK